MTSLPDSFALALTGGGARAAYQVGILRTIARRLPATRFDVITGVSAGAINAAFLASRPGSLPETVADLAGVWSNLQLKEVIRIDSKSLARNVFGWGTKLVSGGTQVAPRVRGLVDTAPLRELLKRLYMTGDGGEIGGIHTNVERGAPRAVALITLNYNTGQTVTWAMGSGFDVWERPMRRSVMATLTVEHVMASAALPIVFPAVQLGRHWFGDGGIRLAAPLSPALHLGATRMLAVSTHHPQTFTEASEPETFGYPPPAQILGQLMDSIFLDVVDEDALRLQRSNEFLRDLPPEQRRGYRVVELTVIRPSEDLGKLAAQYEPQLPRPFRFLTRSLGTQETSNADFMSLFMFVPEYLQRLIEIGEKDAEARLDDIERVAAPPPATGS
ncbi:MAG TPA: patatin-like phospholipase family protein [Thermoanaerobaculia bacterium]|nr:patatin-like phospholipase family protein [Thermoanaerobaculia bacterium]